MVKDKINPNEIKVRDPMMVRLICGATKAGVRSDRRKECNKKACRNWQED